MAKQLNVSLAFTANTNEAIAAIKRLQKELNGLATGSTLKDSGISQITPEIQKAMVAAGELQAKLEAATNLKTGKLDLGQFSDSLKKSGVSLDQYAKQLNALGPAGRQAFTNLAQSILQAEAPLIRCNNRLKEFGTTIANTARWQVSSSILHSFMGTLQSAYGYAQDLNESLNNIRIVTGQNTDQMAEFAKEANKAARALSTTTTAYTDASLIYYQQGLSKEEVKERADITMKMANVTKDSATEVSNQLTAIWNNFYDGSKSLEYYADVLTKLGAATASSTGEIAGGLEKFAAIGETIGLSYEYAAAALATITANTRQSEDVVGTALKTIFARIQGLNLGETLDDGVTLNKYSEALNKVGISIFEQNGELKHMDAILDEMGAKWQTLNASQQTALAQTVAGVRQYNQLMSLMENWDAGDSDSMMANLKTAENATGELQNQADIYAESWEAARDRVSAAAEELYGKILDDDFFIDFLDGLEKAIDGVSGLIDAFGGLDGVLLTIGTLVTRIFQKEMVAGLKNAAYNLKQLTPIGERERNQTKSEAVDALRKMKINDSSATGTAENSALDREASLQELLFKNAKKLTEEEVKQLQIQMDLIRSLDKRAISAAKAADAAEKELKHLQAMNRLKAQLNATSSKRATVESEYAKNQIEHLKKVSGKNKTNKEKAGLKVLNKAEEAVRKEHNLSKDASLEGFEEEVQKKFIEGLRKAAADPNVDKYTKDLATKMESDISSALSKAASTARKDIKEYDKKIESAAETNVQASALGQLKKNSATYIDENNNKQSKSTKELADLQAALKQRIDATIKSAKELQGSFGNEMDVQLEDDIKQLESMSEALEQAGMDAEALDKILEDLNATSASGDYEGESIDERIQNYAAFAGANLEERGTEDLPYQDVDFTGHYEAARASAETRLINENTGQDVEHQEELFRDNLNNTGGLKDWADTVANTTSIIMGMGAVISSVQGVVDTFNNPDASNWEKVSSVLGVVMSALPLVSTLTTSVSAAMTTMGVSAAQAWLSVLGPVAAIVAGVTAVVLIVNELSDAYNKDANAAKRASEAANNLSNSAKDAQNSVNDLLSTFDSYDSAIDKLEECAEKLDGTAESTENWQNALNDVNDQIWNILEKYPELAKMPDIFKDDGTLNRDVVDSYIAQQKNKADNARASALSAKARASQLQVKSDATNLRRGMSDVIADNTQDPDNYAKNQAQAFEMFNGLYELAKQENFNAEEFNTAVDDYIAGFEITSDSFEDELRDAANDIRDLGKAAQAADTQMENVGKLLAKQVLGANATEKQINSYSSNYSKAEKDAYDKVIEDTKNGINIWSGKDDAELQALWERYSKATGTNYQLSSNAVQGDDLNRSFEYINEEGIKVVISAEELAAAIASSEAQTQAQAASRDELLKPGYGGDNLSFLNGEIDEAVDTSLLNDLAQIMDLSDAATRQAIDAQLNMGQTAAEQTKIIEDMLSKMTAEEQELAEISQLKADAIENYELDPEIIEEQAEQLMSLYKAQGLTEKEATKLAIENQRMNKGVENLVDNWEDWNKELQAGKLDKNKKGTAQYAKTINDLTKTIADLTGASADLELPDDFFDSEKNLKLIEQAAQGSEQAINELGMAVGRAQVEMMNFTLPAGMKEDSAIAQRLADNFQSQKEIVLSGLTELQTKVVEGNNLIGQGLENILSGGTEGANAWIASLNEMALATNMSVEQMNSMLNSMGLEAEVTVTEKDVTSRKPVTRTQMSNIQTNEEGQIESYDMTTSIVDYTDVPEKIQVAQIATNGQDPGEPVVKFIGNGSVSPSSKGKSSGGGSKKSSTKKKSDEIERYHTVNKEIESIESKMSRASSAKDNAFGKNKIPYINKEIDALNELIEKHQEYKAEIEKNLKIDEANISQYGFIDANADGILDNWEAVMERELEAFNKAAQAYDKGGSEAAFEAATKRYEDFKAFVEQYEETQKLMEDALAKEEELERERISKQLEEITVEIEFEIEINQRDLDKLDYIVDKLGRNLHTAIEQIDALGQQIGKYDNQSQFYRQGIEDIKATAAAEGRALTDEEQRKIWEYEDALLDINGALLDIVETVEAKILEEFDEFNSKIDDNISRFDTYNSMLDHYNNIIKLSGRQTKDSMLMMELSAQKTETSLQKLNATRDKYLAQKSVQDDVASKLAEAQKSGNEADIKYWQEQYDEITKTVEESHDEMLASWEETLEAAGSQFDLAIETTIQTLKDSISEFGLDNLADRYSKGQEEQERYLSNLDKEYELNKLNREISGKIDDTDNIRAKQKLLELQDEINKKLASGEEMSRYDLEHLQKKYELELAKIALEEAQNAKSTVRLTKDSEGNFGYVYTADQDSIDNAQQNYEDKLYELKKSSEDYLDEMSEKIIQNQQEMMEALAEVDRTKFETQEEYEAELDRIKEYYMGRDKYYRGEMQKAMDELGITYQETLLGQLEGSASLEEAQSKLETNTNETVSKMGEAWKEWHDTVGNAMEEAGTSSETFTEDIKSDAEEIGTATEDLADVIDEQTENMVDYMGRLVEAVADWRDQYISAIDEIIKKNEELANVQAVSFDKDADYAALINEYLNNGGEVGDATYKELRKQRDAKIDWLEEQGYDSSYWGTRGSKTDEMYSRIAGGDGSAEENEWFTKDYIDDEKLVEIFNKLEVPLGALEQTVGNINTGTQEIKTATDTVGGKIDATQNYFNATSNAINTKNAEISGTIRDKLDANSQNALNQISTTEGSINQGISDAEKSLAETLSETVSGGKTLSDIDSSISDAIAAISADIDAAKKEIQKDIGSLSRQVNTLGTAAVGGAMGGPAGALIGGLVGGVISAATTMDTGGYTGSWGPEGKVAVLHEKELVLNKNDTSNLLNTLGVMKDIMHMIDVQANMASLSHLNAVSDIKSLNDTLEQNVTIHAEFPNATNRNEIEEAFSNLVNRATQYANRKK